MTLLKDQILSKSCYADPQSQALYNERNLSLCHTEALNACDRIQELGRRTEPYIRVKQNLREPSSDFLQRLTKAVQIEVTDPDARQVLTESLDLENAKRYLGL